MLMLTSTQLDWMSTLILTLTSKNTFGKSTTQTIILLILTINFKLLLLLLMLLMVVSLPNWVHVTKTKTLHLVPTKLFKQTVTGVLQ